MIISYNCNCRSIEAFILACNQRNSHNSDSSTSLPINDQIATIHNTFKTTAILEAGRRSLDTNSIIEIVYNDVVDKCKPIRLKVK